MAGIVGSQHTVPLQRILLQSGDVGGVLRNATVDVGDRIADIVHRVAVNLVDRGADRTVRVDRRTATQRSSRRVGQAIQLRTIDCIGGGRVNRTLCHVGQHLRGSRSGGIATDRNQRQLIRASALHRTDRTVVDIVGDVGDVLVGRIQLRTIDRVSGAGADFASGDVDDLLATRVDSTDGHARAASEGQPTGIDHGIAGDHRVELRVLRHQQLQVAAGIHLSPQVGARIGASCSSTAHDANGFTQLLVHRAAVAGEGDRGIGQIVQLRNVDCIAVSHTIRHVGNSGTAGVRAVVVGVATQGDVVVGAVVVHHRVGGGAFQLGDVDCIGIDRTSGHTSDLAGLAISHIAYADGAQSALPGSTGIGGSQLRQRIVSRDAGSGIGHRACAKGNTVGGRSRRSVTQGDRVDRSGRNHRRVTDGNGADGSGVSLRSVTNGERVGRQGCGLVADRRRVVAAGIGFVTNCHRTALGGCRIRAQRRAIGTARSRVMTECRSGIAGRRGVHACGYRVIVLRVGA
ncbi:hypothetical protein D9M71_278560 [compost metagenome]